NVSFGNFIMPSLIVAVGQRPQPTSQKNRSVNHIPHITQDCIRVADSCAINFDDLKPHQHFAERLAVVLREEIPLVTSTQHDAQQTPANQIDVQAKNTANEGENDAVNKQG